MAEQDDLGIEVEIALQFLVRQGLEQAARVEHVAAVKLRHARAEGDVLQNREAAVGKIARHRHAAAQRFAAKHARSLDHVGFAGKDRLQQIEDELRRVLSVGMDNGKSAATEAQAFVEAALLRAAVAFVLLVMDYANGRIFRGKAIGYSPGLVGTGIVDNDEEAAATEKLGRNPLHRRRQHSRGFVGRHNNAEICGHLRRGHKRG